MRIHRLDVPECGALALVACPGVHPGPLPAGRRDALAQDLAELRRWGATALLTLLGPVELRQLGVVDLGERAERAGLSWLQLPIVDYCAPDATFETGWQEVGPGLLHALRQGGRIAIHCQAGIGRTGTVAARILVELGVDPPSAIERVRAVRPGAIESDSQVDYLLRRRWERGD